MNKSFSVSLSTNIWIRTMGLILIALVITLAMIFLRLSEYTAEKSEALMENSTLMAIGVLELQASDVASGYIDIEEAQANAIALFEKRKGFDLGENGFITILRSDGYIIYHPKLSGTQGWGLQDKSEEKVFFVQQAILTAMNGGGFTTYQWLNDEMGETQNKMAYSAYFEPWDWIIMSTSFTEETDALLSKMMIGLGIAVLVIFIVSSFAVKLFISDVVRPLNSQVNFMRTHTSELEAANMEVQALYEEMLASEEMLQYNYHELDRYKKALEDEKENYRKILMASNEVYWQYDVRSNEMTITNFGKDMNRITSTFEAFVQKVYPDDRTRFETLFRSSKANQSTVFEIKVRLLIDNVEGVYHWYQILTIHEGDFLFGSMTDIHQEMISRERIEFYAFHDPVLGLYNMDFLNEIVKNTLNNLDNEETFVLMVIGVVGYSRLLNAYGKNITDIMAFQLSAEISALFSDSKYIATLHSGRFAVWMRCDDLRHCAAEKIAKLEHSLRRNVGRFSNIEMPLNIAYGATHVGKNQHDSTSVILEAETAFEFAVSKGIHHEIKWYDESLRIAKERTLDIEQHLIKAIDKGEMYLAFQSQLDALTNGNVYGYEALLRWKSPELGLVSPVEFIPLAESIDLINDLGRFVIDETVKFIAAKRSEGRMVNVSINASYKELLQSDYIDYLIAAIEKHQIDVSQIHIEITETTISEYLDIVLESLNRLTACGFEIHMDDFGTGYSSLYQLGKMPIKVLKIDKSFVWALDTDVKMRALTKLIIDISHRLDMKIIAEGVETQTQYEWLAEMGCDYYQGYLLSKPVQASEI